MEALQVQGRPVRGQVSGQVWNPEEGRLVRKNKWEKAPLNKQGKPSKDLAQDVLNERLNAVTQHTFRELKETSFSAFADKWLTDYALGAVKRSTYQAYESHIHVHFKPAFGPLALQAIREDTIQGYLAAKLAGGAKPKSVKNHLIILKEMLRYAVEWGLSRQQPRGQGEGAACGAGRDGLPHARRKCGICSR